MKKNMMKVATFVLAMTAMASFSACSDSNESVNEAMLAVNEGTAVVNVNRLDGRVEIPVTVSGAWTAEVKEVSGVRPWAEVVQKQGDGQGKVVVRYDYFNPAQQQMDRTAEIVITSGQQPQTVRLRQYVGLHDGETASNNESVFYDLWMNKGMGFGFAPLLGRQLGGVINVSGIEEVTKKHPQYATMLRQDPVKDGDNDVQLIDTLQNDTVKLGGRRSPQRDVEQV